MEVTMLDALVGTYKADRATLVSARGCTVTTDDGRELLDFVSGIGVNALGYGHPVITAAVQAPSLPHAHSLKSVARASPTSCSQVPVSLHSAVSTSSVVVYPLVSHHLSGFPRPYA